MTVDEARGRLEEFLWAARRTRILYVESAPTIDALPADRRLGFFEPVLLCLCWCDYLGALYLGEGRADDKRRVTQWLRGPMADVRDAYRARSDSIYESYRNGLIHGYAPRGFFISHEHADRHLEVEGGSVILDVPTLLDDLVTAVENFSKNLHADSTARPRHGTVEAMANALAELSDHE